MKNKRANLVQWLINPQRFDRYTYAQNNPLQYTYPTGLSFGSLKCCDSDCAYFCADDGASNSNPGGSEGSPSYPLDPPEDDPENDPTPDPACDEECQRQKRLKAQEECEKDCMKNSYVKELVEKRNSLKTRRTILVVAAVGCIAAGIFTAGTVTAFCGTVIIIAGIDNDISLNKVEEEIRDQGCACVL